MRARLVFGWKLLERDKRRCQGFGDHPFVAASDSLFGHRPILASCQSLSASSCSGSVENQACHAAASPSRQQAASWRRPSLVLSRHPDKIYRECEAKMTTVVTRNRRIQRPL